MKYYIILLGFSLMIMSCIKDNSIKIQEQTYKEALCYKVQTSNATYYLEKESGGFSSIIDKDGKDWIDYKTTGRSGYPAASANVYRGLPNLIHKGEDHGVGHPGSTNCTSEIISDNTVRVKSKSGLWQWTYTFHMEYVHMAMEKVDTSRSYWILYEGVVGGKYNPKNQYWGTSENGHRTERPSWISKETIYDNWQWVYFGDFDIERVFFMSQNKNDGITDCFGYLGDSREDDVNSKDGMNVFGFGKERKATPMMKAGDNVFYFGFYEQKIEDESTNQLFSDYIDKIIQ